MSRCLGDESEERKKRPGGQSTQLAKGVERMPSMMQERVVQRGASAIIALDAFRACRKETRCCRVGSVEFSARVAWWGAGHAQHPRSNRECQKPAPSACSPLSLGLHSTCNYQICCACTLQGPSEILCSSPLSKAAEPVRSSTDPNM
jgi:hypothetical protein